jgi:hypothetical protein
MISPYNIVCWKEVNCMCDFLSAVKKEKIRAEESKHWTEYHSSTGSEAMVCQEGDDTHSESSEPESMAQKCSAQSLTKKEIFLVTVSP